MKLHIYLLIFIVSVFGESQRNIIFIVSDDLATRLGCYGDQNAITPNLDDFSKDGMIFDRAYVQGTVCTPSRTSFMLGLNNKNAKRNHFIDNPDTMTMGRYFKNNGYQTFSTGKIDHSEEHVDPLAWSIRVDVKGKQESLQLMKVKENSGKRRIASRYGIAEHISQTPDFHVANEAINFFKKTRDKKKQFFAAIGFYKPHQPTISTKKHFNSHDISKFNPEVTPEGATPRGYLKNVPGLKLTEEQQRTAIKAYYSSISTMDEQFGRIINALKEEGLYDSTLILFTSDHGYHLGWRGQWAKHHLDEQIMRVPLIIRHGSIVKKDSRAKGIVELIDIFPTFIEYSKLNAYKLLDGKSFLSILTDYKKSGKNASFCYNGKYGRTVRTIEWRFTERINGKHELYHLPLKGKEYFNVIENPAYNKIVLKHRELLINELGPLREK